MTESQKTNKISRRDAIKLLGAVTGATVLANLPSKWKTPEIARGVLPAHAQTSNPVFYSVTCGNNASFQASPFNGNAGVTINLGDAGINIDYLVTCSCNPLEQTVNFTGLGSFGTIPTGAGGIISVPIQIIVTPTNPILGASGQLNIFWWHIDQVFGCTQTFSWVIPGIIP